MKRVSILDVKTNGTLKVKRHILVITSCEASSNLKGTVKDEDQVSSKHVTVWEVDDLEAEVNQVEVPKTLEDEGQAIVYELKELNLRTQKIHVPSM